MRPSTWRFLTLFMLLLFVMLLLACDHTREDARTWLRERFPSAVITCVGAKGTADCFVDSAPWRCIVDPPEGCRSRRAQCAPWHRPTPERAP